MAPRLTSIWQKRANQVVEYIEAKPGATGKEIAYNTGVALSTVHKIIKYDPRAFQMARDGKVAVVSRNIKPSWYDPSMKLVPVVKADRLDPSEDFRRIADNANLDPKARRVVGLVAGMVAKGIANPTRSVSKRRREAIEIVSNTQVLALGYTEMKTQNEQVVPRLAHLEQMVYRLTVSEHLENRYGKSDLRKKPTAV